MFFSVFAVALLAEGVDRNNGTGQRHGNLHVALLAEGVDRNPCQYRGASVCYTVALLAEGVDRNSLP